MFIGSAIPHFSIDLSQGRPVVRYDNIQNPLAYCLAVSKQSKKMGQEEFSAIAE